MCQVTRSGAGELPSPTPAGTNRVLPGSLGWGSQSATVFLVQVLAFLGDGAPSLPRERHQMQGMPCRDAPEAFWKDLGLPRGSRWHPWEWCSVVGDGTLQEPAPSLAAATRTGSPSSHCTMPRLRVRLFLNLEEEQQGGSDV